MQVYKGQDFLQKNYKEYTNTAKVFPKVSLLLLALFILITPLALREYYSNRGSNFSIFLITLSLSFITCFFLVTYSAIESFQKRKSFKKGIDAETKLKNVLEEKLRDGFVYFTNITITERYDIDAILIGPYGIFIIECKNYTGVNRYSKGRWFRNNKLIYHNPFKQLLENKEEIEQLLLQNNINLPIYARLYWHNQYGNSDLQVSKEYEKYIWRNGQTIKMFNDIFTKEKCDKQQINKAIECIKNLI